MYPVPEWWRIRVRREMDEVIHPSRLMDTIQACGGSGFIWFSWSRFSKGMCSINEATWLCEYTVWAGFSRNGWFNFLMVWAYSWQRQDSSGLNSKRANTRHHFHAWIDQRLCDVMEKPFPSTWWKRTKSLQLLKTSSSCNTWVGNSRPHGPVSCRF